MEALLFLLFVAIAIALMAYFLKKPSRTVKTKLSAKEEKIRQSMKIHSEKLNTANSPRLSNREEVWRTRRQHLALASESAEKTVGTRYFKYKSAEEPTYDGYSRSDRHHITPARIKRERHLDDIELPTAKFRTSEKLPQPPKTQ